MRERRYLTFDMENPRHCEAFALFSVQSGKRRSEYVVDCILRVQQDNDLEDTMRRVISEALNGISLTASATEKKTMIDLQMTESLSDLPDALLFSLDEI
jgi:hypothetical protein